MRPKIILAVFLPTLLVIGAIIFLKTHSSTPAPVVVPAPIVNVTTSPPMLVMPPQPAPAVVKKTPTPEEQQTAIDAETDRLSTWAMNDDPQSLSNILNDLTSPEKEIRMAAIEAAKQFESTNAIPVLNAAAANAADNEEAIAMLKAAEWLALPSADFSRPGNTSQRTPEQMQQIEENRARAEARRQERMQRRTPKNTGQPDSQSAPDQNAAPPSPD